MDGPPEIIPRAQGYLIEGWALALGWLGASAAWSQFALLLVSWGLSVIVSRRLGPKIAAYVAPPDGMAGIFAMLRRFFLRFMPLLLPLLAYGFIALGESITRSLFGSGAVIAFAKRVFLFIAARVFVSRILREPFLKLLGRCVLVPVAAIYALGLTGEVSAWLESLMIELGNITFPMMALIRGTIAGSLLFWLGGWSNRQSADYIKSHEELRPATKELAAKAAEIVILGAAFLLLLNIMGIDLTTVAVLSAALGVGIGLGLQQIAANFINSVILLIEGQPTVGDYVELDGGEAGTIVKMTARACILETFDGRWIVVPNEHFITTRVVNYSDQGSANRYEVAFSVSYDTDINKVPDMINRAVAALPFVLRQPEGPDCELTGFGDSGIDDGRNKFASQLRFAVWNALKEADIEIPYPHRVVELKGGWPK